MRPELVPRAVVYASGRRIDAEMIRSLLEGCGLDARVWASGMGAYRMESALSEMTGVPTDFNSYRVAVLEDQEEEALSIIDQTSADIAPEPTGTEVPLPFDQNEAFWARLRSRGLLVALALLLLVGILLLGPPD